MRTSNIKLTIEMPLPINTPDDNGNVYSRAAVREAVRTMGGVPLKWRDEIIGAVDAGYIASERENSAVLRLHATIPFGGTAEDGVLFDDTNRISGYHITEVSFYD